MPGTVGSIAICILTKYKASFQGMSFKLVTPDVLVPLPITMVKIPSSVESTLKVSAYTEVPVDVPFNKFTLA
jgi:hypothetical protein